VLRRPQPARQELEQAKLTARQEVAEIERIRDDLAERKKIECKLQRTSALLNRPHQRAASHAGRAERTASRRLLYAAPKGVSSNQAGNAQHRKQLVSKG